MTKKNRTLLIGALLSTTVLDGCEGKLQVSEQERWLGNAADCPETLPAQEGPCQAAEGRTCRYSSGAAGGQQTTSLCGCWEAGEGELRWDCYLNQVAAYDCPDVQPANGAGCEGLRGAHCWYPPRVECECASSGEATWKCSDTSRQLPGHPTGIDGAKPVSELDAAERDAWCQWYLSAYRGVGFPPPAAGPLTPDGMTTMTGCTFGQPFRFQCTASIPELPLEYCVGNLALSTCQAPVSELSDCVLTAIGECWPSPHGCARYLSRPGCAGTIAVPATAGSSGGAGGGPSCSVKVQ
ncbi:MAG: hypothetical protein L6Q84_30430 [Polyangiaceae bacterium]|nr:hypothetical protein [Polyangiaceae bacterium]